MGWGVAPFSLEQIERFVDNWYAHLATLRRSVSGKFDVANASQFDAVMNLTPAELEKKVLPFLRLAAGG